MSEQTPAPPSYGQATNPPQATTGALAPPQPVMQASVQLPTVAAQPQMFWTVGPNGQPQMFYASAGIPAQPMPAQPIPQAVAYFPQVGQTGC